MELDQTSRIGLFIGGLAGLFGGGSVGYVLFSSYGDIYVVIGTTAGVVIGGGLAGLIGIYLVEGDLSAVADLGGVGLIIGGGVGLISGGYFGHILLSPYGDIYGFMGVLIGAVMGAILLGLGGMVILPGFLVTISALTPVLYVILLLLLFGVFAAICYGLYWLYSALL